MIVLNSVDVAKDVSSTVDSKVSVMGGRVDVAVAVCKRVWVAVAVVGRVCVSVRVTSRDSVLMSV